jgi:hypothetical protein
VRFARCFIRTAFEAGREFVFRKDRGFVAQIFENLVGREVEVMLLRSVAARKGGGRA